MFGINFDASSIFSNEESKARRQADSQFQQSFRFEQEKEATAEKWRSMQWSHGFENQMNAARRAGISPLAALGGAGYSPTNIQLPSGQSPVPSANMRSSGNKLSASIMLNAAEDKSALDKSQIDLNQTQAEYWQAKANEITNDNFKPPSESAAPNLYIKTTDNIKEAQQWKREGYHVTLNPDLNYEISESIGAAMWSRPLLKGSTDNPAPAGFKNTRRGRRRQPINRYK